MTIGERVNELRKNRLKMTLEKFGGQIGLKKSALSLIENNRSGVTDQTVLAICREFGVSEAWLRTGEGEPFKKMGRGEEIKRYVDMLQGVNDGFKAQFAAALAALEEEDWKIILDVVNQIKDRSMAKKKEAAPPAAALATDQADFSALSPEEQELIRQFRENGNPAGRSAASDAV